EQFHRNSPGHTCPKGSWKKKHPASELAQVLPSEFSGRAFTSPVTLIHRGPTADPNTKRTDFSHFSLARGPPGRVQKIRGGGKRPHGNLPMSEHDSFGDFLRRLRAGDEQAAVELVQRYERVIRREARLRLTDPRLGRLVDSVDICQSVLASFFVRAA